MTIVAANWIGENTTTVGTGPLALSGAISTFCPFSVLPDGSEVYYTLQEGFNRETGIGVVYNGTLTRNVQATLVAGIYTETDIPISLVGNGQVFAVINADFMTRIYNFSLDVADSVAASAASAQAAADSAALANDYETQSAQNAEDAAASALSASDSKVAADASKTAAASSADSAANSQADALASKNASAASEANSKSSENASAQYATNASNSAAAALASQNAAKTSEDNSLASKTAAGQSALAAKDSENNAKTSETNAKASETAAKTSENNAKASELAAENARDQVQQIINDAGEQSTLVVLAQPTGAGKIGLSQGGKVQDAILYRTVEMFGAVGDGTTDDSTPLQNALNWVTAGPYRKLIFSSGKKYRHSTPLDATFNASSSVFCQIDMQGAIYPDAGVGNALTIQEATYCFFNLKVVGDGYNVATLPDYSQADPTGGQQAFVINSCRACSVHVNGHSYAGRVLRTKGTGTVKLSFLDIQLRTGEGSCGQAAFLQATSDAFGRISHAQTQWDYYGSVLDKLTDVTITYWEYGNKNSAVPALLINDCGSLDGSNITGGSAWDADTSTTLKIVNGQGLHFSRLQVGEAYHGLIVEGAGTIDDKPTVVVDYLISYKTHDAVTLNNTTGVQIKSGLCDNTYNGVVYKGHIYNCRVNMDGRNNFTAMHSADTGDNIHSLTIGGGMYTETSAHFISMLNATVGKLFVNDTNVRTLGRYLFLPLANDCVAIGGKWEGSINSSPIANRPKLVANISGFATKYLNASINFASGSSQGSTVTITHGLWATPYDISITPYNIAAGTTFSTGNIVLKTLNSTQAVLMYTGSAALSADVYLVVELKAESRPD